MKVIILAAGKGTRMQSEKDQLPKVLRRALGRPLISYPLSLLDKVAKKDIIIVTGFMREAVMEELGPDYTYAIQAEQKGTGHAVMCAADALAGYDGPVMILNGDMPLLTPATIEGFMRQHRESGADGTVLAADIKDSGLPYGRVECDADGKLVRIVEDKDCDARQKQISLLNVGLYIFDCKQLLSALSSLKSDNAQGELYLTDVPEILARSGKTVRVFSIHDITEALGVNTPADLAEVERNLTARG